MKKEFKECELTYNTDGSIDKRCKEYKKVKNMYLRMLEHGNCIKEEFPNLSKQYIELATKGLQEIGVIMESKTTNTSLATHIKNINGLTREEILKYINDKQLSNKMKSRILDYINKNKG